MRPLTRLFSVLLLASLLSSPAVALASESSAPMVLLSDFRRGEEPSPVLVSALREHEGRRLGPEARLRRQSPDDARVIAMLEAAKHLE